MNQEFRNTTTYDDIVKEIETTPFDPSKIVYLNADLVALSNFDITYTFDNRNQWKADSAIYVL